MGFSILRIMGAFQLSFRLPTKSALAKVLKQRKLIDQCRTFDATVLNSCKKGVVDYTDFADYSDSDADEDDGGGGGSGGGGQDAKSMSAVDSQISLRQSGTIEETSADAAASVQAAVTPGQFDSPLQVAQAKLAEGKISQAEFNTMSENMRRASAELAADAGDEGN
jgi:hypothetical protein